MHTGLKHKEGKKKREWGGGGGGGVWGNKHLVSFPQSKFSHFLTKTSWVGETIPSYLQELGWNFRSVCLLLGYIQPVAIENAACRAALCCEEIAFPLAPGLGFVPFYLYKSRRLHKHQHAIVSSLTACLVDACLLADCWLGRSGTTRGPSTIPHLITRALMKMVFKAMEQKSKSLKRLKSFIVSRHQNTFAPPPFNPLSNCHRTFRKNQRNLSKQSSWHQLPLRISFPPLTQTHGNISCWKDKNVSAAILGLCKEI